MEPNRIQRVFLFAGACAVALQISPGLASGPGDRKDSDDGRGVRVVFTKLVTDWPNMAGLVSGDVGGGTFAGEILKYTPTAAIDEIEAGHRAHDEIGNEQSGAGAIVADGAQGIHRIEECARAKAGFRQDGLGELAEEGFVIDNKN